MGEKNLRLVFSGHQLLDKNDFLLDARRKDRSGFADVTVVREHEQGGEWMEVRWIFQGEAIFCTG